MQVVNSRAVWSGTVLEVPRGGLNGNGRFKLTLASNAQLIRLEDVLVPLLADSRPLSNAIREMNGPAVAMLPSVSSSSTIDQRPRISTAFAHPVDEFQVLVPQEQQR